MDAKRAARRAHAAAPWAGLESVIQAIIGVLSLLIVVRLLGPEAYGRASLAIVIVALIEAALTGGLNEAIVKARSVHSEVLDTLFWTRLGLGLAAFAICYLVAVNITSFFEEPELPLLIGVYGATCIVNALSELPVALLTRKFRGPALAKCALVSRFVIFASSVALAVAGAGSWSLILSALIGLTVQCAMLWSYIPRRPGLRFNPDQVRPLVGFGLLVSAESLLVAVVSRLFLSVFGYFHGVEALGYLNFAVRLVDELAMVLTRIAAKFAYPLFAALERGGTPTTEAFLQANRLLTYGAFPMFAGIGLVASDFVAVFFGAQWAPSIVTIQILAAYWVLATSRFLVGPLFRAVGRPSILLYLAGLDATLSLVALIVGSRFGPVVTTWLWAARILLMAPLTATALARVSGITVYDQIKSYAPASTATSCMAAAVLLFKSTYPLNNNLSLALLLDVALGAIAFTSVLLAVDRSALALLIKKLRRG